MGKGKYKILIIDDEQSILDYYNATLCGADSDYTEIINEIFPLTERVQTDTEHPFDLFSTTSGAHGIELLKEHLQSSMPISVAFIDMRMPGGLDGLETAIGIRKVDPHAIIIFATAFMDYELSQIRNDIGNNFHFLSKPLNVNEIYQVALSSVDTWEQSREMRRINQSKDDYLASVSHELRTPLSAIIGNVELVVDEIGDKLDLSHYKMLETSLAAARSQLALVNDILDLSKLEAGKFQIDKHPYDLNELVSGVKALFTIKAQSHGLKFNVHRHYQPEHLLVGDQQRIHQILVNLLSNAIKFTEQGFVQLSVEIDEGDLLFKVEDSGIGIDAVALKRLFKPYAQADKSISRKYGGTGLGLNISLSLANEMGGSITTRSVPDEGSCFALRLPLQVSDQIVVPETEESDCLNKIQLGGHVLLAEDTKELQVLVSHMLECVGLTVDTADDGQEAVEKAIVNHYDLILMDMRMPVMDGIQATKLLRKIGNEAPIIALTANVMTEHKAAFITAGANGFIKKPIERSHFITTLSEHLSLEGGQLPSSNILDDILTDDMKELFIEQLAIRVGELKKAIVSNNLEEVKNISHQIKGTASTFGYNDLSSIGADVTNAYRSKQLDIVKHRANDLLTEANSLL